MDEAIEELVIDVRASTDGFAQDLAGISNTIDTTLVASFDRAGQNIERGLIASLRRGSLGFDDLKRIAFRALDDIAAHALQSGIGSLFGEQQSSFGGLLGSTLGALLGLPGRANGGLVSQGQPYWVGERGPEVFVPSSFGRIEANTGNSPGTRDVRVAIQLSAPRSDSAPTAMRRSSRQIASAIRQSLEQS